jgi:hypothetical protein
MELAMRRVLLGSIRLPRLAARAVEVLGSLIELPILSLFSAPKCLPWLTAGGSGAAGADGLVVPIGLAMLWALLEATCLSALAAGESCLPIKLPRCDVLPGLICAIRPVEADFELLAGFVFPTTVTRPNREVVAEPAPVLMVLDPAAVEADSPFPFMELAMLCVRSGLTRLLEGADRELDAEEADVLF